VLQIKPHTLFPKECYNISHEGYSTSAQIWVSKDESILLEETSSSFNIEELEQIITFMKSLDKVSVK